MRIGDAGGAGLAGGPARHEPEEIDHSLVGLLLLVLVLGQTLLEELVDDEVYHCLTDPPPRGSQTLPEAEDAALGVDPPHHHGQAAVRPVQLQPGLDQPDRVGGARAHEPCEENQVSKIIQNRTFSNILYLLRLLTRRGRRGCRG